MKFDLVTGNPPYQENDGGAGVSASPVYHKFIEKAKTLDPDRMSMIIPAKWYSGGKGLEGFRNTMLRDRRIRRLVDYTDSKDCFPDVDVAGGICYFLWDKNHQGDCSYTNTSHGETISIQRNLGEYSTFIRYPVAADIVKKVRSIGERTLDTVVSGRKPFGLDTRVVPEESGDLILRYNKGKGAYQRKNVRAGMDIIDQWKVIISYLSAEHAGQPDNNGQFRVLSTMEILKPLEICSETYLVAGAFDSQAEAENYMKYLKTRFVRFLVGQVAVTQHITRAAFSFVPVQDFRLPVTDQDLYRKYRLDDDETAFIEKLIKEMA